MCKLFKINELQIFQILNCILKSHQVCLLVEFLKEANNMIPQIAKRQIGNVAIIDIRGAFSGSWALRGRENLRQVVGSLCQGEKVIFNLSQTSGLDTLGVRSILASVSEE